MKKILVVEDDEVSARMLCDYLGAHGYETSLARNGAEGVSKFTTDEPDLVILDVALPRKNGFEVCFELKRTERGQRTPILMMSAVFPDEAKIQGYWRDDLNAQDWLSKPFELGTLLTRVHRLLGDA